MRKTLLSLGALLLVITGCSAIVKDDPINYVEIQEIAEKFENEETFVFILGGKSCPACAAFLEGPLSELEDRDDIRLDYVDLNAEDIDEELVNKLVDEKLEGNLQGIPTTYFITDGVLTHHEVGVISYETLIEGLEE